MTGRGLLVWLVMLAAAVANGAFREMAITPRLGDSSGRVVSSIMLACIIIVIGRLLTPWLALQNSRAAWFTGLGWMGLTLAFEFLGGHFLFHTPWSQIVREYDIGQGRIWIIVPIATLLAPVLGFRPAGTR